MAPVVSAPVNEEKLHAFLSQALGAVATQQALADTVRAGGFTRFRRATQTPFNRIFEARR